MPTAWVPQRAAAKVALPLPHATSSTSQPALRSAASASSSLASTMRAATTAKSPLAQVFCWRALMTDRSVRDVVVVMTAPFVGPRVGHCGKEPAAAVMPRTSDGLVPPPVGQRPGGSASSVWQDPHTLGRQAGQEYGIRTTPGRVAPGIMDL